MTEETKAEDIGSLIEMPKINMPVVSEVKKKVHEGFKQIFDKLEDEIEKVDADVSTAKGRQELISLAFKISRTKTGLDKAATALTEEQKALVNAVNEERRQMKETLDAMRDRVRGPVTAWENAEKERIAIVESEFSFLRNIAAQSYEGVLFTDMSADQLEGLAGFIDAKAPCSEDVFLVAAENFNILVVETHAMIEARADEIRKEERDRQELAALRARQEREELERKERAEAEAEAARIEAQKEQMAKEAAELAQRQAQEEIDAQTRRAAEAEREKAAAEEARIAAEAKAERVAKEAEEAAKKAKILAEKEREEAERVASERAEREKLEAIEEDRRKREASERAERAAEEARAANLEHRKKINNGALKAIVKMSDVSDLDAKTIVEAIAKGQIPNVKIEY